jgi:hypothetical protein
MCGRIIITLIWSSRVLICGAAVLFVGVAVMRIMGPHYERLVLSATIGSAVAEPAFGLAIMGVLFIISCDVAAFYAAGQGSLGFRHLARGLLGYPVPFAGTFALRHAEELASFLTSRKHRILLFLLPQVLPVAGLLHYWLEITQ